MRARHNSGRAPRLRHVDNARARLSTEDVHVAARETGAGCEGAVSHVVAALESRRGGAKAWPRARTPPRCRCAPTRLRGNAATDRTYFLQISPSPSRNHREVVTLGCV